MPVLPAPRHAPRQSARPRVPGQATPARSEARTGAVAGRRAWPAALLALALVLTPLLAPLPWPSRGAQAAAPDVTGLRVAGNRLVNGAGQPVRLLGVNRAGAEYACIQGWGIFEGPTDAAAIAAITSWHTTAVRLPLNETCWLGINGAPPAYSGAAYQGAIRDFVDRLNAAGLVVILDLHWSAPGGAQATGLQPMPNRDHSVAFWRGVAAAFRGHSAVIFDLFNEPYPDGNADTAEAWRCWRDGGTCRGVPFQAAGMQELVDAVCGAGAPNVILLGGVQYANSLSGWLAYKPADPLDNLAAAWHAYDFGWYTDEAAWERVLGPTAARVPLVAGELGQGDCGSWFVERAMAWLDGKGAGYLGWPWNVWGGCDPTLITDYSGSPSAMGRALSDHLAALAAAPPPAPLQYYPLPSPVRLLDTRAGVAVGCDRPGAPLAGGSTRLQAARIAGTPCAAIPASAQAVVGNATAVNTLSGAGGGYLTLFPSDVPGRPTAASVNYPPGAVVNNAFTTGLSTDDAFKVYAGGSTTHLVIDITGYYAPPGAGLYFHPLPSPVRLLDTRAGQAACDTPDEPLAAGSTRLQPAAGTCTGIPASAQAVVGHATAVNTLPGAGGGYLTLFPSGVASPPTAASVNFAPGAIVNNATTVGLGPDDAFNVYVGGSTTHLVIDLTGYFAP